MQRFIALSMLPFLPMRAFADSKFQPPQESDQSDIDFQRIKQIQTLFPELKQRQAIQFFRANKAKPEFVEAITDHVGRFQNFQTRLEEVRTRTFSEDFLKKCGLFGFGQDKHGHPIMYIIVGKWCEDANLLDHFRDYQDASFQVVLEMNDFAIQNSHTHLMHNHMYIIDISGVDLWTFCSSSLISELCDFIHLSRSFPEQAHMHIVINAPWYVDWFWYMISWCFDQRQLDKFEFCGSEDRLFELVEPSEIPTIMGGKNNTPIHWGHYTNLHDIVN